LKPKVALAWQLIPCTLPKLSYLSWLAALIAFGTAPVALGHPISPTPTPFHPLQDICWLRPAEGAGEAGEITVLRSQGGEGDSSLSEPHCSPIHQKVSTRAADLVLDKPDRPPSPLAAEKLTETDPTPQPPPNPAPGEKQPFDTLDQAVKDVENPITDRVSIPLANRTAFGIGPFERTANLTTIAPVLPISLGENYLVVRPSLPFVYAPTLSQPLGGNYGLGDLRLQAYFVPKPTGKLTWGIGPTFLFPTASYRTLGFGKWGIGPAFVAVWRGDRLTVGGQIENYWSVAGDGGRPDISQFTVQPFATYTLAGGWYLVSAPVITAFWNISSGEKWLVPIGGGIGKVIKLGDRPLNISIQAYWQPIRPLNSEGGWALVVQFQSLFPR
jgi:hypothetical protein